MKLKKLFTALIAVAMFATLAVGASAFEVILGVAETADWTFNTFDLTGGENYTRNDANVTGDGEYTVSVDIQNSALDGMDFIWIDFFTNLDEYPGLDAVATSFKVNGTNQMADDSTPLVEDSGRMRITVANPWSAEDGFITTADTWTGVTKLEATFTVSGIGGSSTTEAVVNTDVGAGDKGDVKTGAADVAVASAIAVLAAGAVIIARKKRA